MLKSDVEYLREAYKAAEELSTDPSTQNGAILVDAVTGDVLVREANHFPQGVVEIPERWERPAKYQYVEHAERNVIFKAASQGVKTKRLVMYCPWYACADCARAIIQAGITEVVGHQWLAEQSYGDWKASIAVALKMFEEAGVKCRYISDRIGGVKIRFNGKIIEP